MNQAFLDLHCFIPFYLLYFRIVSLALKNILFKDFIYSGTNSLNYSENQGICWNQYLVTAQSHQVKRRTTQQSGKHHREMLH